MENKFLEKVYLIAIILAVSVYFYHDSKKKITTIEISDKVFVLQKSNPLKKGGRYFKFYYTSSVNNKNIECAVSPKAIEQISEKGFNQLTISGVLVFKDEILNSLIINQIKEYPLVVLPNQQIGCKSL